eukprot:220580_1
MTKQRSKRQMNQSRRNVKKDKDFKKAELRLLVTMVLIIVCLFLHSIFAIQINISNYSGTVYISDNVLFEEFSSTMDIDDKWSIYVDNRSSIDDLLYNNIDLSFEWKRSNTMTLVGNISSFNFNTYYKAIAAAEASHNENHYIDYHNNSNLSQLYEYCTYPVPSSYAFGVTSEWIHNCTDSNADPFLNVCDSPSSYLTHLDQDIYVKFFECDGDLTGNMMHNKWYHSPPQLTIFAQHASTVKIVAVDITNNETYAVTSNANNSFVITNLILNRALSHPFNYIYGSKSTYFSTMNQWNGDTKLLEAMMVDEDQIFNATQDFNYTTTVDLDEYNPYSMDRYLYHNERNNSFNIDFVNHKCSVFGDERVHIELYYDIGLSFISSADDSSGSVLSPDTFIGDGFSLYSYGQHSNLQYYRYPEDQYFSLEQLSPGQYYTLAFEYNLDCVVDSDFEFGLFALTHDFVYHNATNESVWTEVSDLVLNLTDINGNSSISYRFMAESETHLYAFIINGVSSPTSPCYTEIEWSYIISECLGNDDVFCTELQYDIDSPCKPFHVDKVWLRFDDANQYCLDTYDTNLFCPTGDSTALNWYLVSLLRTYDEYMECWMGARTPHKLSAFECINPDDGIFSDDAFQSLCQDVTEPGVDVDCSYWFADNMGDVCPECVPNCVYYQWFDSNSVLGDGYGGINSKSCVNQVNCALCKKDWQNTLDPIKLEDSGAELDDIDDLQECIQLKLQPFLNVSNLKVTASNVAQENITNETCVESLAAIMAVDPLFEDEFGCEVEYVDDITEILPMYEVKYDIYLGNTSKFAFSGAIYMESIDDMVLKSDIVSELGFNFMHRINGIDIKAMNENMMIRYIKNDDNYTLTIDSYQYISESVRPFYYTTNTWDSNSCDGTLVHGLSSLAFDLMCADNHIDVNRIYNAHNSSFVLYQVPISSFISNRIALVDDWNLLYIEGILLNQVNDYLSVDVHSNGDLSTPSWLFEAKLPSFLVFESEELNQIKFVVPIIIESVPLSGDDDDSSFAIAFALTDSQSFVAVLLECEYQYNYNISDQVLCLPLFYPDGDSNTLGRINPKYHSVHFMNWTWNDDYIDLLLSINTDEETNVELIIQNDPAQYSVSIELSIDSVSVQYRRDQNTGSFLGNRDLYFQFGHYTTSVLRYEVGAISMQRNQVMTNSFANNASDWALAILNTDACDDCIEMMDDSGVIAMNYLDLSLVLQWTYPDDAYFLNDHISSIKTVIQLDTSNNNQIFVFGDATNYILFTVGHLLHYSFYPQTESYIANVGDDDIFTDLEVFTSIISTKLSKINDYDIDNATVTAELIFECVNDPVNDMVQFKLYHADHEIVMEYKGSFESLSTLYLYFGAYSSNEVYTIESIHYEKLLTPNIEFVANIDSEDDLLRQIASTYSNPSTLVTALFANIISLDLGGNNSNGTNYWNLELSAAFDNCNDLQSNTTSHPRDPGYARVTVFEYNESISYREELFDISILQTECPSTIELYIEHPTYYNPLFYFNNCTNSTANENCTASNVHEIPFMIRWMDDKYSYIFKLHYFYGPYKPSSITYEVPHHIIEPRAAAFWLFEETSLLSLCLLLIVFGLCCTCCSCIDCKDCSCKWYLMRRSNIECIKDANRKCCCCVRCNSPSKGEYILDGSKIKRDVLDNVIFHHFDENAYHHLLSHSAAKYKEKIIGTKLSPFELSLYTMPAAFIVAITIVYTMAIFTDSAAFIDSFDDLFFNHAFTAFFAFLSAIILYILTILCIYLWFSKWKKVDFFSGEILQRRVSPALAKTDNAGKSGPIIRFFNELNKEQERETRAHTRTQSIWKKETEWRKESEKYEPNASFKFDKHCLFMVGDCCCRLLNAFIFTFSFWISFYAWYSHQEITVLYDVTNAIYALNSDTEHKMNIIQDWQDSEYDAMLNYYNLKVTQCNSKISINNERANAIMYNARQYHVDQMYPAITDLLLIESELRLKLDNILNGAELSEYAGEVDLIMDEIQTLSDNSINLVSDIVDTAENAIHSLCIATGVVSTGCSGGMINCGTIVSASCYAAAAHAISAIDSAVNEAIDALEDIKS